MRQRMIARRSKYLVATCRQSPGAGDVFSQGRLDGLDYRKLLRGAIARDASSLDGLFRYTANGKLMGEGYEDHSIILWQLLQFWGDKAYARVLAVEPSKVRASVVAALDNGCRYPGGWQPKDFPVTYRLAKHVSQ